MSTQSPTDPAPEDPIEGPGPGEEPRRFGNYLLLKELGRGAQGVVYLAENIALRRKVALKMLTGAGAQSQVVRDRFRREAELTSKFEHPGICGVHDFGEVDGLPYIAMQYVRGTTLAEIVEKARRGGEGGPESGAKGSETITIGGGGGSKGGLEDVLRLVERAARAMHVAHEAGLVHRDIKPANIMVTPEGHPVLLDFGLARDLESEGAGLTQSGQILGTPAYLAPEQIVALRGKVDRRTDVYALGVTLFECLTQHRPFEAGSWDQLFHEILNGAPRNPRKWNPRIPLDLCTVVEVAMDRDPTRRYPTAEALAEDLRRVRSFEPIQAKAAGPVTRLRKWSRRNPGQAVGAAAVVVFVSITLGVVTVRFIQRGQELRQNLRTASERLVAADYVGAAVAVAKAQELDPDSAEVIDLRSRVERGQAEAEREAERKRALAGAQEAREEAARLGASYEQTRQRIDELGALLLKNQSAVYGRYADDATRVENARRERELYAERLAAERMLLSRSEALERAARLEDPWGGASGATQSALAGFYMERWREALQARDTVRAEAMRTAAELHDKAGEHRDELLGRGTLTLAVAPAQAESFLFRYEDYESLRPGAVIPRLVPVPTTGVGRVREGAWDADFHPGDPCLVVRAVEPGSIAAKSGLIPGDLVVRFAGGPAIGAVYVRDVAPGSCLASAGISPLARIADVDGSGIGSLFDWVTRTAAKEGKEGVAPVIRVEGRDAPLACDPREIPVASALDLVHRGAPVAVRLECLRGGEPRTIELAPGARAGLTCETTAYPLILAAPNRVAAGEPRTMDPGSYLLLVRSPGFEDQRFHFVVERGRPANVRVDLLPGGDVPEGFVHVPPGPFVEGGDPAAFRPREARTLELPGFFLARKELTNREWYEFVNDPATLAKIAAAKPGEHLYLPQDDRVMAKKDAAGESYVWDVYTATAADSPVLGLSWSDVTDYLAWRNARAEARGEPWRYDLPSEREWEKAARGVDARTFPWGNRFDPSLAVCLVRKDGFLLDAPGGFEPRDESPFGVLDMAGSREEWTRDVVEGAEAPRAYKRGGHWGSSVESLFHSASRGEASRDRFASSQGVRLVARRP
ncbi:MAG: SUMF1/EgtB/PvdO family nonheme iron enzyme [Planctomycetota bacterium]|nr:SUMF1/EgtB/PvdO family nonheme iron enzyme [Planctomycetota bacterium]